MEQHTNTQPSEEKPETGRQFFDWLRSTGIRRAEGGWIGGVFSAVSQRTGWDATLLRGIGVIALILVASPTAMLYGLAWLLVPDQHGRIHAESAVRGQFSAAVVTSGLLAVLGAVNVFTPLNIGGPFAVLINLLVIGAVIWGAYVLISRNGGCGQHQRGEDAEGDGADDRTGGSPAGSSTSGDAGGQGKAPGPRTSSKDGSAEARPRADGRPAWYPKDSASAPDAGAGHSTGAGHGAGAGAGAGTGAGAAPGGTAAASASSASAAHPSSYDYSYQYPAPAPQSPQERAERRRRRMLTWGLILLIVPATAALAIVSGWFGLSTLSVLALGAAALVVLLAFRHMSAAARGRKGNGFALGTAAGVMVVLTVLVPSPGEGSSSSEHYVFGNYTTSSTSTTTAFSNTVMDLRGLSGAPADGSESHHAKVNMAFANTTVVVPDEARVLVNNGHAMGNLDVRTQDGRFNESGIAGADTELGPEDAETEIQLDLNSGFGNVEIYDATTYAEEVEGR